MSHLNFILCLCFGLLLHTQIHAADAQRSVKSNMVNSHTNSDNAVDRSRINATVAEDVDRKRNEGEGPQTILERSRIHQKREKQAQRNKERATRIQHLKDQVLYDTLKETFPNQQHLLKDPHEQQPTSQPPKTSSKGDTSKCNPWQQYEYVNGQYVKKC